MVEFALPEEFPHPHRQDVAQARRRHEPAQSSRSIAGIPTTGENPRIDTYWVGHGHLRPDDPGRADQDQRTRSTRPSPSRRSLPRGDLRLVLDEHRRHQHARLHLRHGRGEGRREDLFRCPHMPVVKDLIPRPDAFSTRSTPASSPGWRPRRRRPPRNGSRASRIATKLDGDYECILCALLLDLLPQLLVERRPLSGTGGAAAGASLDRGQPRRGDGRTAGRS